MASLVGFITLFGIATRNGILLISHYRHLLEEGGMSFRDAISQGSMERLSPVLMTAPVTGVGLIPPALGADEPGREIQQPMAVVILGGIVTSTFLNMAVIPALYLKFGGAEAHVETKDYPRETGPGHADLIALATVPDYTPRRLRLKRETGLQHCVKQSGGNWISTKRVWEIHHDRATPPGLKK